MLLKRRYDHAVIVLKLVDSSEGSATYDHVGEIDGNISTWKRPQPLGESWGEGEYLLIDTDSSYGIGARVSELRVVQSNPTYEAAEDEPADEEDAPVAGTAWPDRESTSL